jgi:hypothetical protein
MFPHLVVFFADVLALHLEESSGENLPTNITGL